MVVTTEAEKKPIHGLFFNSTDVTVIEGDLPSNEHRNKTTSIQSPIITDDGEEIHKFIPEDNDLRNNSSTYSVVRPSVQSLPSVPGSSQTSVIISFPEAAFSSPTISPNSASSSFSITLPSAPSSGPTYNQASQIAASPGHSGFPSAHSYLWISETPDSNTHNFIKHTFNSSQVVIVSSHAMEEGLDFNSSIESNVMANKTRNKVSNIRDGPAPNLYPISMTNTSGDDVTFIDHVTSRVDSATIPKVSDNIGPSYQMINQTNLKNLSEYENSGEVIVNNDDNFHLLGLDGQSVRKGADVAHTEKIYNNTMALSNFHNNSDNKPIIAPSLFNGYPQKISVSDSDDILGFGALDEKITKLENSEQDSQNFGYILHDEKNRGHTLLLLGDSEAPLNSNVNPLEPLLQAGNNKQDNFNVDRHNIGVLSYNSVVDGEVPINERARALFGKTSDKNKLLPANSDGSNKDPFVAVALLGASTKNTLPASSVLSPTIAEGDFNHNQNKGKFNTNNLDINNHRNQQQNYQQINQNNVNSLSLQLSSNSKRNPINWGSPLEDSMASIHSSPVRPPSHPEPPFLSLSLRPPAPVTQFHGAQLRSPPNTFDRIQNHNRFSLTPTNNHHFRSGSHSVIPQIFADQLASLSMEEPQSLINRLPENVNRVRHPLERIRGEKIKSSSLNPISTTESPSYSWGYFFGRRSSEETQPYKVETSEFIGAEQIHTEPTQQQILNQQNTPHDRQHQEIPTDSGPWNVHFQSQRYHQYQQIKNEQTAQNNADSVRQNVDHSSQFRTHLTSSPDFNDHAANLNKQFGLADKDISLSLKERSQELNQNSSAFLSSMHLVPIGTNSETPIIADEVGGNVRKSDTNTWRRTPISSHRFRPRILTASGNIRRLPSNPKHPIYTKHFPPNFPFHQLNPFTALPTKLTAPPPLSGTTTNSANHFPWKSQNGNDNNKGVQIYESLEHLNANKDDPVELLNMSFGKVGNKNVSLEEQIYKSDVLSFAKSVSSNNLKNIHETTEIVPGLETENYEKDSQSTRENISKSEAVAINSIEALQETASDRRQQRFFIDHSNSLEFRELSQPLIEALQNHPNIKHGDLQHFLQRNDAQKLGLNSAQSSKSLSQEMHPQNVPRENIFQITTSAPTRISLQPIQLSQSHLTARDTSSFSNLHPHSYQDSQQIPQGSLHFSSDSQISPYRSSYTGYQEDNVESEMLSVPSLGKENQNESENQRLLSRHYSQISDNQFQQYLPSQNSLPSFESSTATSHTSTFNPMLSYYKPYNSVIASAASSNSYPSLIRGIYPNINESGSSFTPILSGNNPASDAASNRNVVTNDDRTVHGRSLSQVMPKGGSRGALYIPFSLPVRGTPV